MAAHKIITGFLNTLLIIGAILWIATIDQGKWIPAYLTYLSTGVGWDTNNQVQNTHPDGGEIGAKVGPQAHGACLAPSQLSTPEWEDIYLFVDSYNAAIIGGAYPEDAAKPQVVCEK